MIKSSQGGEKMNTVYIMNITPLLDKDIYDALIFKVVPERQKKANRLVKPQSKAQSLGAGLLLRSAIEDNTDLQYETLNFLTEDNGKPYIENNPFYFSLSHSGNLAACVISDSPVGIDIEFDSDLKQSIKEKYPDCQSILDWTKREARGKLTGNGFFDKTDDTFVYTHHKTKDGYVITVCSNKKIEDLVEIDI